MAASVTSHVVTWSVVIVTLLSLLHEGHCLKCYKCQNALSNEDCNKNPAVNCEEVRAADVCQTKVTKSKEGVIRITKNCGVGPCDLGNSQTSALGLNSCDRKSNQWECIDCCSTDMCNVNNAPDTRSVSIATRLALAGFTIVCVILRVSP